MSVIKQISVFNGSDWSTGDIGADASNIDISSAILGSSTNVQSALTTIGNKIGTTAIPSGLGTTLTGAINTLNTNLNLKIKYLSYEEASDNFINWLNNNTYFYDSAIYYIIINTTNASGLPEAPNIAYCIYIHRFNNSQIFYINSTSSSYRIWKNQQRVASTWTGWQQINTESGIESITLSANGQTETTINLPASYPSNNYIVNCNFQLYTAANMVSAVLIRDKTTSNFTVRIYYTGSSSISGNLLWSTKYHGIVS